MHVLVEDQVAFLKKAMEELGMTREQFAEWLNVPPTRLRNWMLHKDSPERRPIDRILVKWLPAMVAHEVVYEKQQRSLNVLREYITIESTTPRKAREIPQEKK